MTSSYVDNNIIFPYSFIMFLYEIFCFLQTGTDLLGWIILEPQFMSKYSFLCEILWRSGIFVSIRQYFLHSF